MSRKWKRRGIGLLAVLLILGTGFGFYVSDFYRAGETAKKLLSAEGTVQGREWLELSSESNKTGLIFYPGAKVEYSAYLPLMQQTQERDISCYLVEMPFNLAILDQDRAKKVIDEHPEIEHWYIGGHSMGGAFAGAYAGKHPDAFDGLILLGAYRYGDYPAEQSVIIYGSEDQVLNRGKIGQDENVHVIEGGNHAMFGDYGEQKGDGKASIAPQEQWVQTANIIEEFVQNREKEQAEK